MPMSLNMDCMAQIAGIDIYMPIKIDVLTSLTLNNITTNQQYYNIHLRAGPILAVLIHSLLCCSGLLPAECYLQSEIKL